MTHRRDVAVLGFTRSGGEPRVPSRRRVILAFAVTYLLASAAAFAAGAVAEAVSGGSPWALLAAAAAPWAVLFAPEWVRWLAGACCRAGRR